jgi:hypothetical protein
LFDKTSIGFQDGLATVSWKLIKSLENIKNEATGLFSASFGVPGPQGGTSLVIKSGNSPC